MSDPTADDRRAELIAAAATSDLTAAETAELDAMRAADPSIDREIAGLRATIDELGDLRWDDSAPSAGLRDRVLAIEKAPVRTIAPRRRWVLGLGVAACVLAGAGLGIGATALLDPPASGPQPGAPGVLGALEHVDFDGRASGVTIDGSLVAHTWGTETILEIDGLPAGDSYWVVLVADGEDVDSGSFLGSTVTIDCRMNAAVDRSDVDSVQIRDADGTVVASAELPAVGA
jgi:hypothetical protein